MNNFEKHPLRAQEILAKTDQGKQLPEGFWMQVMHDIRDTIGEEPSPLSIRATAMLDALGIPWGEHSALTTRNKEDGGVKYVDLEKDRKIAELLTNIPGVHITNGIISLDPRDLYEMNGTRLDILCNALDADTTAIIRAEYETHKSHKQSDSIVLHEKDQGISLLRLPGGISVFLRSYYHNSNWQKIYGSHLASAYAIASVIGIEGSSDTEFGKSIPKWFLAKMGVYDDLMRQLISNNFCGMFAEFEARDTSYINTKHPLDLPKSFYEKYYSYLIKQNPYITLHIKTSDYLQKLLFWQRIGNTDIPIGLATNYREYYSKSSVPPDTHIENNPVFLSTMTGMEFGTMMHTDALAAIKLHITARLMNEGLIPKGIVVDFVGSSHTSSKSFFMRYPLYAAMVILNNIHELMAGAAQTISEDNAKNVAAYADKLFTNPDWSAIFHEIVKLAFFDVKDKTKLIKHPIDYCKEFGIDPATAIPDDARVAEIMKNLNEAK